MSKNNNRLETMSDNLRKRNEIRDEEAWQYFLAHIDEIMPDIEENAAGYAWQNSPKTRMMKLFYLAKIGAEEPRWLQRIKTLEKRLEDIRKVSAGTSIEPLGVRTNGGVKCDVNNGPCACGAWHKNGT